MEIFNFLKSVGKKFTGSSDEPKAEELKKELDSHQLGTDNVQIAVKDGKVEVKGEVKDQSAFEKVVLAVGNIYGVSEVNAKSLTVQNTAAGAPVFYTVEAGDTLWKIAETQYGKGKGGKHEVIFEANKPMLTSPDKIYPGQVLRIPPLA